MTRTFSDHALINWVHRRRLHLATGCCALLILHFGLIPFDLILGGRSDDRAGAWLGVGLDQSSPLDMLSNIFLFLPLGLMLQISLTRAGVRSWLAWAGATMIGGLLSLVIESLQAYSATRISSTVDLFANTFGTIAGGFFGLTGRRFLRGIRDALHSEMKRDPSAVLVKIYIWGLIVFSLTPFVPFPNATYAAEAIKQATFIPFQQSADLANQAPTAGATGDSHLYATRRDRMLLWAGWIAEAAAFALAALMCYRHLGTSYEFSSRASVALTLTLLTGLAVLISVLQFPIMMRGFHVTDIVMRMGGMVVGTLVAWSTAYRHGLSGRQRTQRGNERSPTIIALQPSRGARRYVFGALVAVIGYVLFTGLAPFAPRSHPGSILGVLRSDSFLPFHSYFWKARLDVASADFFSKCLRFGALAIVLSVALKLDGKVGTLRSHLYRVVWRCVALAALVETAQIFIRSRVPSLTDLIIAVGASFAAVVIYQYAIDYHTALRSIRGKSAAPFDKPEYGLSDALINTLTEPQDAPDRPVEHSHNQQ